MILIKVFKIIYSLNRQLGDTEYDLYEDIHSECIEFDHKPNNDEIKKLFNNNKLSQKPVDTLQYEYGWFGESIYYNKLINVTLNDVFLKDKI